MRNRWRPIAILAGLLLAINLVARLLVRVAVDDSEDQFALGLISVAAMALVAGVAGFWWTKLRLVSRVAWEMGLAIFVACLGSVLIGPYVAGSAPFREGSTLFFKQLSAALAIVGFGAAAGVLVAVTFGLDWKSQAWKHQANRLRSKPKRTVRR